MPLIRGRNRLPAAPSAGPGRARSAGRGSLCVWTMASALIALLAGCQGTRTQSALHTASPAADAVARLWWVLLIVLGIYSLAVFALMLIAIFRRATDARPPHDGRRFVLIGGVILPSMILVPLLIYSVQSSAALRMRDAGLTVRVVGHRWWWQVHYPEQGIVTANEIHIPVGEPVRLELESADVIHSFWVPQLHGKMDMLPGHPNSFWIEADRPGVYRGQCAEFCGTQHARMALLVVALPPEEFVDWVNRPRQQPPPEVSAVTVEASSLEAGAIEAGAMETGVLDAVPDALAAGRRAFLRHGCGVCHGVAGTSAKGAIGPDLTWIGDRRTIAAATLPNTPENMLAWLQDPQAIKPGANMPPTHAPLDELRAIVVYLESLTHAGSSQ